jgi:uncharacterized membrane protein YjgN (DUF898 family)
MENENQQFKKLLKFKGDHGTLVGLRILNNILTVVTLGIYYPWARASVLKYMYAESEFMDSPFVFHGTGKEMFIGFLKAIALFIIIYACFFLCMASHNIVIIIIGVLLLYAGVLILAPLAVHGYCRYRSSRSSWRGIHFGYRGNVKEFMKLYLLEGFLAIITLGIYGSWFHVNVRKYVLGHLRFGNIEFKFTGNGGDLFLIHLKGILLSIITLGIYSFWYIKDLIAFEFKNLKMIQNGKEINFRSTLSGVDVLGMYIINNLIIIFTLGIGTGIAINRVMRKVFENIELDNEVDVNTLVQTEEEYKDAAGDDLAGMLDISWA